MPLRASWGAPGGSSGRPGRVMGRLGAVLGPSCGYLRAILGRLGGGLAAVLPTYWGRLQGVLGRRRASLLDFRTKLRRTILDTILYPICNQFGLDFPIVETCEKALRYYENNIFEPSG